MKELLVMVENTLNSNKQDETFDKKVESYLSAVNTLYIPVSDFWRSKEWYENVQNRGLCGKNFRFL
jgi:hypothetical protein